MKVATRVRLLIPAALRMYSGGADELRVDAATVGEALDATRAGHPLLLQHILTRDGTLRPYVKVFVRNRDVRDLAGLDTTLDDQASVMIVPSVAGG